MEIGVLALVIGACFGVVYGICCKYQEDEPIKMADYSEIYAEMVVKEI